MSKPEYRVRSARYITFDGKNYASGAVVPEAAARAFPSDCRVVGNPAPAARKPRAATQNRVEPPAQTPESTGQEPLGSGE